MDPLSQAVTGAALAGIFSKKHTVRAALIMGACGGMAPDLDILIRSSTDPLLALEYHRHFTHSLIFSPIGGLLVGLFFWLFPWVRKNLSFKQAWFFSFLGVITHGALDSCTGYGTHLLWPFTNARESWNVIGIIDPLYTFPALLLLMIGFWRKHIKTSMVASLWLLSYLALGSWQHHRATEITENWLQEQQIAHQKLTLRPTIGNLWLWRVLYYDEASKVWQTQALCLPYWSDEVGIKQGDYAETFDGIMGARYSPSSVAGRDLRRFSFFSNGYLSLHLRPDGRFVIGDIRYGMTPDSAQPLWGIEMPKDHDQHVKWHRNLRENISWSHVENLLKGEGFTPL